MNHSIIPIDEIDKYAYLGFISIYFNRIEFEMFKFCQNYMHGIDSKLLSTENFDKVKNRYVLEIDTYPIDKLKNRFNKLKIRLGEIQKTRNSYAHSMLIQTSNNYDMNTMFNRKKFYKNGVDSILDINDSLLEQNCIELQNVLKELSDFNDKYRLFKDNGVH